MHSLKHNSIIKRIAALFLTLVIAVAAVPMVGLQGTAAAAWDGTFEGLPLGSTPSGWTMKSSDIRGNYDNNNDYTQFYSLTVSSDAHSGNKSLAITAPTGTKGYIYAESDLLPVDPGVAYSAKFALKVSGVEEGQFLGARVYISQYDKNGKEIGSKKLLTGTVTTDTDWESYDKYFNTDAQTASIKLMVWIGGIYGKNPDIAVKLDDISFDKQLPADTLLNGDFESGSSDNDISSWHLTSKSMLNEATPDVDYTGAYTVTREQNGYHGAAIAVTRTGAGYVTLDSNMIRITPSTTYFVDAAVRIRNANEDFHSVRFIIGEYDADMNLIGTVTYATQLNENTDWKEISGSYTPSEKAVYYQLEFWCGALKQCYFTANFDDVRITEIRRDLATDGITNGNFEEVYDGQVFDWDLPVRSDSSIVSTFDGYNGTKGVYIQKFGNVTNERAILQSNYFNVTVGERYKLEYMSRLENQVGEVYIATYLYCYDKDGNLIEGIRQRRDDHFTKNNEWQNTVIYYTIPEGTVKCRVQFLIPGTSYDCWMDDVKWSILDYEQSEHTVDDYGNFFNYDAEIYGFDTLDDKGNVVGWTISQPAAARFDNHTYCEGTGSLFVSQTLNTAHTIITCDDIIPLHSERYYLFTIRMKSYGSNIDSEGIVTYAKMYDTDGNYVTTVDGLRYTLSEDNTESDWITMYFGVGTTSRYGAMQLYFDIGTGTMNFWLDDIQWDVYDEYGEFKDDFDSVCEDGTPANWDASVVSGSPTFVTEDSRVNITGNTAKDVGMISAKWNTRYEWVTCEYLTTYSATPGAKAKVTLKFYDYGGNEITANRIEQELDTTNGISKDFSFQFIMPAVNYTIIEITNEGAGTVSFEGVSIERQEEEKATSAIDSWRGPWIWYNEDYHDSINGTPRYFRYHFTVSGTPAEGVLQITADDRMDLYINGVNVHDSNMDDYSTSVSTIDNLAEYIVPGENVIAISAHNFTSYAGLIFDGYVKTEEDDWIDFYSGEDTVSTKELYDGWYEVQYDDSAWTRSAIQEYWGGGQWGTDVPFDASAYVKNIFEVVDYSVTEEMAAGETATVTMTIIPEIDFPDELELKGHLWVRNTENIVLDTYLQQIEGPKMTDWKAGKEITVTYMFEIPDYIGSARYVLQFDLNQVKISNMDILDNKLMKAIRVTNEMGGNNLNPKIVESNGTYAMEIGGEVVPLSWFTNQASTYKEYKVAQYMHSGDICVTRLWDGRTGGSDSSGVWMGYGEYDFNTLDNSIYAALADHTDTYLILTFSLGTPQWWIEENPDECVVTMVERNGEEVKTRIDNESYGSEKFIEEATQANKDMIEHMMQQPYWNRVVGAVLTSGVTSEWLWYGSSQNALDFSPANEATFKKYMRAKYETDEALQKAWNNRSVTLDTLHVPTFTERIGDDYNTVLSPETQRDVLDYTEYVQERIADCLIEYATNITEWTNDSLILGPYYGYMNCQYYYGIVGSLHTAVERVLSDENIDFIAAPVNYHERFDGEAAGYMNMIDGTLANGKAIVAEDDLRLASWITYSNFYTRNPVGPVYSMNDSVSQLIRNFSNQITSNVGNWYYDMWSAWYNREQFGDVMEISQNERKLNLSRDKDSTNEVCYIIDDDFVEKMAYEYWGTRSLMYWTFHEQRYELAKIGVSVDSYHLSDLKKGLVPDHKIYIMIGCVEIDAEEEAAINKYLKNGNKVVLWNYGAGYSDGKTISAQNMSEIMGMQVRLDNTKRDPSGYFTDNTHWLTKGLAGSFFGYTEAYRSVSPMPIVTDASAKVLGVMSDNSADAAIAIKDMGDWTSIYTVVPNVPTELLRNLLKQYDVHVYSESKNDIIFSNSNYVALNCAYGGDKVIHLDGTYAVYDVFAQKTISLSTDTINITMENNSTKLFRLTPAGSHVVYLDIDKGGVSEQSGYIEAEPGQDYTYNVSAEDGYVISEVIIDGNHTEMLTKSYKITLDDLDNSHFVRVKLKQAGADVEAIAVKNDRSKALITALWISLAVLAFAAIVIAVLLILKKKNILFKKQNAAGGNE